MPTRYKVEFLGRDSCGTDVVTCHFSRPEGYSFRAGQWLRLYLRTSEGDLAETFSHCAAPGDSELELTTRLSGSAFKNALAALEPCADVAISAPGGRMAIPAGVQRVCFLAGGVGITPIHSLLRDAWQTGRTFEDAVLFYGNRDERCAPFAEEFLAMEDIGLRTVLCFEHPSESWRGEQGFITVDMVRRHVDSVEGRPFLVAGPPVMVEAMELVLNELAIGGPLRIIERFSGPLR